MKHISLWHKITLSVCRSIKSNNWFSLAILYGSLLCLLLVVVVLSTKPFLFINTSSSAPKGLYLITPTPKKGGYVVFNSTEIPPQYKISSVPPTLLKTWYIPKGGINSDKHKLSIDDGTLILPKKLGLNIDSFIFSGVPDLANFALLISSHPDSYDSRYYGLIPIKCLKGVRLIYEFT